jgi:transglutaminase-like putative cysteine protease
MTRLPGTHRLSRESRDTLFLLGVIAWTLLPQASHVPGWCAAYAMAALGWRAWLALHGGALPGRRWLLLALALAAAGTAWSHQSLIGKDAGITLLVVLAALKTLELRARRDAVVVFFLGFVLVLANFLHSQSLAVALAMGVSVLGLLAALALAHMPGGRPSLRSALALTLRSALLGTPIVLVLFLFFPRLPPLWGMPGAGAARTGLSEELQLGQVAELAADERLAMRIRFLDGPAPPAEQRYFRGPVLRLYDGQRWRADEGGLGPPAAGPVPPGAPMQLQLDQAVAYEATIEPLDIASLPLLEFSIGEPPQIDGLALPLALRDDLHWQPRRPITERIRLRALAFLALRYHADDGVAPEHLVKPADLALPAFAHPRTRAWAAALRAGPALAGVVPAQLAERASAEVLAHIRRAGYAYTLTPGEGRAGLADDAVDAFWLDHREGFCEHYAASFVVVMRALGVPARIVTGYQGGQLNPVDGLLEIRQSDAHAWAEIWQSARGWTRVDPTAAIAPDRIRLGQRLRPPPGLVAGTLAQVDPALLERLRQLWSAADHRWNDWVLHYGQQRQRDLLERLGWQSPDLYSAARTLLVALGGFGLAGAAWAAWDGWRSRRRDPWLRSLAAVQAELARRGLAEAPRLPPRSLALAVQARWGQAAAPLAELLRRCDAQRYGAPDAADAAGWPRPGWRLARELRWALRRLPR